MEINNSKINRNRAKVPKKSKTRKVILFIAIILVSSFFLLFGTIYVQSQINDLSFLNQASDTLSSIFGREFVDSIKKFGYNVLDDINQASTDEVIVENKKALSHIEHNKNENTDSESIPEIKKSNFIEAGADTKKDNIGKLIKSDSFTPTDLEPIILKPELKDEGIWKDLDSNGILKYTYFRPDPTRPYAITYLCMFSIEDVDIHLVFGSGYLDKERKTHSGNIKKEHLDKLIANFSGGFQPIHDNGGIIIDGTDFLPLVYDKGTLVVFEDGIVDIVNYTKEYESEIKYLNKKFKYVRQNQPILIENSAFNNSIAKWGFVVSGSDPVYVNRSGLGVLSDKKHFIFSAGNSLSANTLARSLLAAGCTQAMHLDMNVSNIAFNYYEKTNKNKLIPKSLSPDFWAGLVTKYLTGYSHDYFYLVKK